MDQDILALAVVIVVNNFDYSGVGIDTQVEFFGTIAVGCNGGNGIRSQSPKSQEGQ